MSLAAAILRTLGDDSESTLLILDAIHGLFPDVSERILLEALGDLQRRGLVQHVAQDLPARESPGTGVPELTQGRSTVSWWGLTVDGRAERQAVIRAGD